ncbi:MAG: ubiquinol-cytochrome c reductase iron-sulfur subunit [Steroidobacteraceae bacterium]|nr:ubiquinol-cytochrome c reductase iron-sulfur subunit [Steroidobacteraceae bacterium]MDW8260290.1 ubiquinol-cytochrome c reductase iron-sulfur subunit [Gammaproteobacteria bacterium]
MAEMTMPEEVDESRRKFLVGATTATGAAGAVLAAVPFVKSWRPSESARAAGAPARLDLTKLEPGQMAIVTWRKRQIYVVRRTPEALALLGKHEAALKDPQSEQSTQPAYAKNPTRSARPEILVLIGTCTHLGCLPKERFTPGAYPELGADWPGGFFCPCHGSKFDMAGRVFAGSPASVNLEIPPYSFAGEDGNTLVVGVDPSAQGVA